MQLDESTVKFAQKIISYFDPAALKQAAATKLEETKKDLLDKKTTDRWDKIVKLDQIEDEQQELETKEFSKQQQEYIKKVIGCSKDHGKELDLWNKSYPEKIQRIRAMLNEADKSDNDLQRRAYYGAQAQLVFYYLIAEGERQEMEVSKLQQEVYQRQAQTFLELKRYDESMQQVQLLRSSTRRPNECGDIEMQILFETWKYDECAKLLEHDQSLQQKWSDKVKLAIKQHKQQERELYKKMVDGRRDDNKEESQH